MPITQNFVWNYYAKDSVLWHWTLSTIKVCYLGHIMTTNSRDDRDIQREMHNMFIRTNMLSRRFSRCSAKVKLGLFTSYCLCLYDVGLWSNYAASTLLKFKYCYHKCIKMFFCIRLIVLLQYCLMWNYPVITHLFITADIGITCSCLPRLMWLFLISGRCIVRVLRF